MVAVPRLHEMKYSETRQSAKIIESTKHWKTDFDVNFQLRAYYRQINVIKSKLIWTSWRPRLKIWAYGLKFLGVFTPKTSAIENPACDKWANKISSQTNLCRTFYIGGELSGAEQSQLLKVVAAVLVCLNFRVPIHKLVLRTVIGTFSLSLEYCTFRF